MKLYWKCIGKTTMIHTLCWGDRNTRNQITCAKQDDNRFPHQHTVNRAAKGTWQISQDAVLYMMGFHGPRQHLWVVYFDLTYQGPRATWRVSHNSLCFIMLKTALVFCFKQKCLTTVIEPGETAPHSETCDLFRHWDLFLGALGTTPGNFMITCIPSYPAILLKGW